MPTAATLKVIQRNKGVVMSVDKNGIKVLARIEGHKPFRQTISSKYLAADMIFEVGDLVSFDISKEKGAKFILVNFSILEKNKYKDIPQVVERCNVDTPAVVVLSPDKVTDLTAQLVMDGLLVEYSPSTWADAFITYYGLSIVGDVHFLQNGNWGQTTGYCFLVSGKEDTVHVL